MVHAVAKEDSDMVDKYETAKEGVKWEARHRYELYGIVSHSGGMGGGHYKAYTKYRYKEGSVYVSYTTLTLPTNRGG